MTRRRIVACASITVMWSSALAFGRGLLQRSLHNEMVAPRFLCHPAILLDRDAVDLVQVYEGEVRGFDFVRAGFCLAVGLSGLGGNLNSWRNSSDR